MNRARSSELLAPLIVHVVFRFDFGGLENGIVNLVNRMPTRYRHAIVCLAGYGEEFRRRLQQPGVPVISIDKQPGKDLPAYARMWRVLRELRPAVVHTRNFGTLDMQTAALAANVPVRVHGEHGWDAADPQGRNARHLQVRRLCRPLVKRYVAMSRDIARWLEQEVGVPDGSVTQIYSGVDAERFRPEGPRALPGAAQEFVIGTAGRLDPVKNQRALIAALRDIRARRPDLAGRLRLVIAGEGILRAELESAAREYGVVQQVTFAGARSDMPEIMRSLDVFVLPSINEGISNTILEAMATGVPVVASRVGGNPEVVDNGVCGTLYDPAEPAALGDAIVRYLEDPALRHAHGAAARRRVVNEFSLDAMVTNYLAFYDQALGRS
jgi:sugar transferase (PEP-CTERM/EpsH1 system associated)